ncbi:hypothetical protein [Vibrio phage J14]|nr:hypothetical protein [Vibrio phage J14]
MRPFYHAKYTKRSHGGIITTKALSYGGQYWATDNMKRRLTAKVKKKEW